MLQIFIISKKKKKKTLCEKDSFTILGYSECLPSLMTSFSKIMQLF